MIRSYIHIPDPGLISKDKYGYPTVRAIQELKYNGEKTPETKTFFVSREA